MPQKTIANSSNGKSKKPIRPALTLEARENQMIALCMDEVERRILDHTATSQMLIHFLKLGSAREKLERDILENQKELLKAKTDSIKKSQQSEELYGKALNAFRAYSYDGGGPTDEGDEEY